MKKLFFVLIISFIATSSLVAQSTWKSDPMHSKLTFTVSHMLISDVFGLFQKFDATVTAARPDFSDAVFMLTADVSSINTEVKMRDEDLRSARFFDVAKFSEMTFKSKSIEKVGENRYKLFGNLTMHGITKPVIMDLWYRGTMNDAMSKKTKAGFQLTGTLKRSDFNIGTIFPAAAIGDEVSIKADGEFIKQ